MGEGDISCMQLPAMFMVFVPYVTTKCTTAVAAESQLFSSFVNKVCSSHIPCFFFFLKNHSTGAIILLENMVGASAMTCSLVKSSGSCHYGFNCWKRYTSGGFWHGEGVQGTLALLIGPDLI